MTAQYSTTNKDIEHILTEMAVLYEMKGVQYKPRAYERAAHSIGRLTEEITDIYDRDGRDGIMAIDGVGSSIADHIETLITTGHFDEYEKLKQELPVNIEELTAVEGVGPQTVKTLWNELGIQTLDNLEEAARDGKLRALDGFGEKTEQNILNGIQFLRDHGSRFTLGAMNRVVPSLVEKIRQIEGVHRAAATGSFRRRVETIGDIDILVTADKPAYVMEEITSFSDVAHVYGSGDTKTNIRLDSSVDVDVRVVPEESWGAALMYFTGSKAHNIALRERALSYGWSLNEYGLWEGETMVAGATEKELYGQLSLSYIAPELRENAGEIEAAASSTLPTLIGYDELKGDCQMHSNWSDGSCTIEELARAAAALGHEYIAVTDHTRDLQMTGGLSEEELQQQRKEVDAVNQKLADDGLGITVLQGAEVNIREDGSLDVDDDALKALDIAGAAVHTQLNLSRDKQTQRLVAAMEHPSIDIIYHPTTRVLNKRGSIALDIERVIQKAKETGAILEIDSATDRLDLPADLIRRCVEVSVPMIIDTDAHSPRGLEAQELGIAQARRGWATADDVVNTKSLDEFRSLLKRAR